MLDLFDQYIYKLSQHQTLIECIENKYDVIISYCLKHNALRVLQKFSRKTIYEKGITQNALEDLQGLQLNLSLSIRGEPNRE